MLMSNYLKLISVEQIYRAGLKKLKSTLGDHLDAYDFFYKAQNLGHEEAKAKFAFALLFGLKYNQNIPRAYEIFQELSLKGNSDAHLVFITLNYQFKIFILYYDMFLLPFRVWVSYMLLDYMFL